MTFEEYFELSDRWFSVSVYPRHRDELSIFYHDITERKRREANLDFLAEVSRNLVGPASIDETMDRVGAKLGEYFGLSHCRFTEFDETQEFAGVNYEWQRADTLKISHRIKDFLSPELMHKLQAGETIVVGNIDADPLTDAKKFADTGIRSFVILPLLTNGKSRFRLGLYRSEARDWREDEIELIREIAGRIRTRLEHAIAEEALRESEQRLRVTMDNAVDYAVINTNPEGFIESWSRGAELIFGWTEKEAVGQPGAIIFTPEDRQTGTDVREMETAVREGFSPDERFHIRKDGSRFYMSGVMRPIYDGVLLGFLKIARDLTERQRTEESIRLSEERYRIALQSAEMAAWDWDVNTGRVIWNDQHYLLLGLLPEESDKTVAFFMHFVHPQDAAAVEAELQKSVIEDHIYRIEFRIIRADNNETRWMSGYGRAVFREAGRAMRMVGVMNDITERKRLEQQKEEFISIASHELRTPVTSIKAYAEILEELFTENGDTQSADLMKKMDMQIDWLTSLIYSLLDSTQISGGKLELQKSRFKIDELVTETVESMYSIAGSRQIELHLLADTLIEADRERIRQVLINFISNAIKYAPDTDLIIVRSAVTESEVNVSVRDFGVGIDPEEHQKVFERFFRSETEKAVSGLGLGLFISAGIIREHGGRIGVESNRGEGALFSFTLPVGNE